MLLLIGGVDEVLNSSIPIVADPLVGPDLLHLRRGYDAHGVSEEAHQLVIHPVDKRMGADQLGEGKPLSLYIGLVVGLDIRSRAPLQEVLEDTVPKLL